MTTEPSVILEETDFAVVNKPAGLIVHRPKARRDSPEPALTDWLLARYPEVAAVGDDPGERPGIVHRLDKETSGIMLVPRNQTSFEFFKAEFQAHRIRKTYLALVHGEARTEDKIDKAIGIKDGTVKRSVHSEKFRKPAVTSYRRIRTFGRDGEIFSMLEVSPETGRTHQIRVHLASVGHPIAGDPLYGRRKEPVWVKRLMLHALRLEFSLPDGRRLRAEAAPPPEFGDQPSA